MIVMKITLELSLFLACISLFLHEGQLLIISYFDIYQPSVVKNVGIFLVHQTAKRFIYYHVFGQKMSSKTDDLPTPIHTSQQLF